MVALAESWEVKLTLVEELQLLKARIDSALAHLGSSTHEDKQSISPDMVDTLVVHMKQFVQRVEGLPAVVEETAAELGAAGEPPPVRVPPPSGIMRSGK